MLLELNIKNFAIIDDLTVSFTKGLNLLTGETGAGKSIIIEALGIILGNRGHKNLIRVNENTDILQALFLVDDLPDIEPLLNEYGIDIDEDKLLIITREISLNKPSISRINDKIVTLSVLNKISSNLVDIFAQHEHQSLLNVKNHKLLVDSFGDNNFLILKNQIKSLYKNYIVEKRKLEEMSKNPREREREIALLEFQVEEITKAQLEKTNESSIENEYKKISNIKEISFGLDRIIESFRSSHYENPSILDLINKNISILNNLTKFDNNLDKYLNRLNETYYELEDLYNDIINYIDTIYIDNTKLNLLSERLDEINNLKRKYGHSIEAILEYKDEINSELDRLKDYDNKIKEIKSNISKQEQELYQLSNKLSKKRKNIANMVEKQIIKEIRDLNMEDIDFKIVFSKTSTLGSDGIDYIEFLISTNSTGKLKPLSELVSGGEMSRIMLAFKSVLANYDRIPTMIFDEIDTGISGRTAQVVGEQIEHISNNHQIISITHLPQIAALADSHYLIFKKTINDETFTSIKKLNEQERVHEMARLLGGVDITSTTLHHAQEMIEMSKKVKDKKQTTKS